MKDVITGTCDGTGAAIHVCLGFKPSVVQVFNLEDATDLPTLTWARSMAGVSAAAGGVKEKTAAGLTRALLSSAGISHYDGGDTLIYDAGDGRWETTAGADASEAYVNGFYNRDASSAAAYQTYGDYVIPVPTDGTTIKTTPGFTIGTDADMNVDGQQLVFVAWR
jgi:hypothetical protein